MAKVRPPVYVLCAVVAMLAVHWLVPVARVFGPPWRWLGLAPLVLGAGVTASALWLFRRRRTTAQPFGTPASLVTSGPFRITRHPMYAGIIVMLAGVAWLLGTLGPWFVIPVLGILFDRVFVRGEEERMERTFGEAYRRYKSQVRRWL